MPVYAPTTDELRSELSERARQLGARLEQLDRAIDESVDDLRAIAADSETLTAERVKALNVVNRSLHASADAARKELSAAQRLLRVELPTPMEPGAFAAAAAAGQIAGISDADRAKLYPPRPGLDDLGDAGLRDLPDDELQAQRRAYYVKGSG
jgi:type II secretory pathway component HofQ